MERDAYEQKVLDDVARIGWCTFWVGDNPQAPPFVYTVGIMATLGHPEIIVFGLERRVLGGLADRVAAEIKNGRSLRDPVICNDLVPGLPLAFRRVHPSYHTVYLGYAMWHRRYCGQVGTLEAVQCFCPDGRGLFPWDDGRDPAGARFQPRLDLAAPWAERNGGTK